MAQYQFKLPDVGEGTAEAEIVAWHVKIGDKVKEDQPLVDMMTDKATVELSSPVEGVVQEIAGKPGDKAAVGSVLVTLETGAGGAATATAAPAKSKPAPAPQAAASAPPKEVAPAAPAPAPAPQPRRPESAEPRTSTRPAPTRARLPVPGTKPAASPAVRRRAEELGIKLQFVAPSGPHNRITHTDLDAYVADESAMAPTGGASTALIPREGVEDIPVIGLRRQIAERMQAAKRHIPHFSYVEEIDVTALEDLRAHLNANKKEEQPKLTLLPFLIQAMLRALPEYPEMNALYDDEGGVVHRHAGIHVGIATQTDKGLMVPVLRHAEARDLWDMANEITRLAQAARTGQAKRDELSGSTITITSLGTLGGVVSTPVINRPEVAILNPNRIVERPVVKSGQVVVRKMMNLSSSFDHRVVDGYNAAAFIQRIRGLLEQPATMFMA